MSRVSALGEFAIAWWDEAAPERAYDIWMPCLVAFFLHVIELLLEVGLGAAGSAAAAARNFHDPPQLWHLEVQRLVPIMTVCKGKHFVR